MTFYLRGGIDNDNFGGLIELLFDHGLRRDQLRGLVKVEPDFFIEPGVIRAWAGRTLEWMYIETIVFAAYLATMLILVI